MEIPGGFSQLRVASRILPIAGVALALLALILWPVRAKESVVTHAARDARAAHPPYPKTAPPVDGGNGNEMMPNAALGSQVRGANNESDEIESEGEGNPGLEYLEWLLEDRIDRNGVVKGSLLNAVAQAHRMPFSLEALLEDISWQPLGPAPLANRAGTTFGGRTNSIAIDPRDPNVIYLAAALGGVWKTTDGGQSWIPLTDNQPSLASGGIAIAPSHPDTIYVGTGEENFSGDSLYGAGVLRSDNAGATWAPLGADVFVDPSGGGARTSRILVDPKDSAIVYVGTTWGLWKSTDGGQTWVRKLSDRSHAAITDLIMHPDNSATLYAAVSVPNSANNKGIYRSLDFGETWQLLDIGLAANQIGRINLAIAPSDPQILYASIGNAGTGTAQMFRLKSIDGGSTWQRLPDCTSGCNQQSYNNIIRVHSANPDVVYQGAVQLFRTTDGGQSWSQTTRGHVDHHWLVFDQLNNLYIGSDGGIFRINADDSTSDLNTNLATIQFYPGVALHPLNSNLILAGTQDNGSDEFTGDAIWTLVCGGDGAYQAFEGADGDPDHVWYCSSQHLGMRKTTDGGQTTHSTTNGITDISGAAFVAPFRIDPNNSNVLIAGTHTIWRTQDGAASWQPNSELNMSGTQPFRSLAFAPLCSGTTYFAGSTGRIWRTADAGGTWTEVTQEFPSTVVTQIVVSPLDCNTVYASFSGFNVPHLFRSNDAGDTWTNISSNLPNAPTNAVLLDASGDSPVLYVGTDIGVFRSLDDGGGWEPFNNGLPNVRVEDLVLNPTTGVLVASTHGRGMWQLVSRTAAHNQATVPKPSPRTRP